MNGRAWISFSITPVQRFIEGARTVRDLASGSAILSFLVREAIAAGEAAGAQVLFPSRSPASPGVPNKVLLEAATREGAESAARAMRERADEVWKEIGCAVRRELEWDSTWSGWDLEWNEQIENYFEILTVLSELGSTDNLTNCWRTASHNLQAAKARRRVPPDLGRGRHKCTLLGELDQMGPAGDLAKNVEFWKSKPVAEIQLGRIGLDSDGRDRLCAVSLVKRFAPAVARDPQLAALRNEVPSTREIAVAAWRREAAAHAPDELEKFDRKASALAKQRGLRPDEGGEYLAAPPRLSSPATQEEIEVLKARADLLAGDAIRPLGAPPRYFAVLVLDTDELGRHLGGDWAAGGLPPDHFAAVSRLLEQHAASTLPAVVRGCDGYLAYAGGDDTLALLPAGSAVACARMLRALHPQIPSSGRPTTASAGVAIVHYKHALVDALQQARDAVVRAKAWGRDGLALTVVRRSGNATQLLLPWTAAEPFERIASWIAHGVSDRWIYAFAQLCRSVHPAASLEATGCLLRQLVQRVEAGSPAGREEVASEARLLLRLLHDDFERRLEWRARQRLGGSEPAEGLAARATVALRDALLTAAFLARGGE